MLALEVAQAEAVATAIGCNLSAITDLDGNVGRLTGACVATGTRRLGDRRLTGAEKVHVAGNVVTVKDPVTVANDIKTGVPNVDPKSVKSTSAVVATVASTTEMSSGLAWWAWVIIGCSMCLCASLCGCGALRFLKKRRGSA